MVEVSADVIDKIIKIVRDGGGTVFEEDGYINFCGVRNNSTDNTFNDTLYIYWKEGDLFKGIRTSGFTTKPGKHWVQNSGNSKGVAIVKEGWHPDVWKHGVHNKSSKNGHNALIQTYGVTTPITITRDKTQYGQTGNYTLNIISNTQESGQFGVNMHRSGVPKSNSVGKWSAGCQVFQFQSEFEEMLKMTNNATKSGQKTFSYFLTNKNTFEKLDVVDNSGENSNVSYVANDSQNTETNTTNSNTSKSNSSTSNSTSSDIQYSNNVSGLGSSTNNKSDNDNKSNVNVVSGNLTSFGKDVIFGKVFPNDDNNRYIDMPSEEISVIQYSEPSIKVEDLNTLGKSRATMGVNADKISYYIPVVYINDFMIPQTNITNFCLDYTSFVPQVMVEFVDISNEMLSTNIPKPGSHIKVFVGGHGDEKYYKPIRQDFVITNISKTNRTYGEYQNYPNSGNPIKYKFTGILNIPLLFRKMPWSSSKINARQAMFNISNLVGLGFATNFTTNSDVDVMRWVNTQNKSYSDFMKDITLHSCYSPYTFFTSFIDQYYVLNFVECRRLLSHGGEKDDLPQMIYNCIMPDMGESTEQPNEELNKGDQKVSYYFLTNSSEFKGWTNYIEEYYEINDGYSMMSDGFSKILSYSDKYGFHDLLSKNYQFLLTPIDNLKRDENKNIMSLPDVVSYDTYIPLNLRQTTNSTYTETQNMFDNPTAAESRLDLGEVDTSNNYPLYFYAAAQNNFQMKNLRKCGLSIRLQNYNPSITRYSRIWVDIYDMNQNSITQIRKNSDVEKLPSSKMKEYLKLKNENIISFPEDETKDNEYQVYNRSLSGWYVVTDMKISYNTVKDFKGNAYKKLQTHLILNRIDYKPTFQSEYEMAKQAIEKYKNDNLSDDIMCGGDIL